MINILVLNINLRKHSNVQEADRVFRNLHPCQEEFLVFDYYVKKIVILEKNYYDWLKIK